MLEYLRRLIGKHAVEKSGAPTGSMGFQWTEDDFEGHDTPLAIQGGPEFVNCCIQQGSCQLEGKVLEKFKEIVKKFPIQEDDDDGDEDYDAQDHFAVVVRQGLIEAGLIPVGDPDRYQYKISMAFIHFAE